MLHVLRTHEKWQQCLASNQSKINRSQETKTNIISFSHSLRMHVSLYVRIRKGRVIHLRHFNVRMDYRISIGNSTMVPIHHRYHKFVTFYCKCIVWLYWVFSTTNSTRFISGRFLIETQKYDTKIKGLEKPYFLMPLCRDGGW